MVHRLHCLARDMVSTKHPIHWSSIVKPAFLCRSHFSERMSSGSGVLELLCLEPTRQHHTPLILTAISIPQFPPLLTSQTVSRPRLAKMTRLTRPTHQSPTYSDFFAVQPEDEDLLMEQSLLEAVDQVQTPTTPPARAGRRSRRASPHPPAYDPAQPNAQGDALPYDPVTWNLLSSNGSGSGSRRSTPVLRQAGSARYSPTTPAYSPSMHSHRQHEAEQYDPCTPLYRRSGTLYDLAAAAADAEYGRRSSSMVAGGEPSPGYGHYDGYGVGQASPTSASVAARLDNISDILRSQQGQIDTRADRLDRLEAQLTAIADFLTDELNGSKPTVNRSSDSFSNGSNKRKRWLKKRVSFTTSDSADDDDDEDEDGSSTPSKKQKTSPSPKTPSNKRTANPSTPPKAPHKAAPKRPAPPAQAPSTPARQTGRAVATPAAPRKQTRTAQPAPASEPGRMTGVLRRSSRTAAVPAIDYSDVKRKKTKEVLDGGFVGKCGMRKY
jgi:hypothetical protein